MAERLAIPRSFKVEAVPTQGKYTYFTCQRTISIATMSTEEENSQVFKGTTAEDVRLENLGYEQGENRSSHQYNGRNCIHDTDIGRIIELKRSFGLLSMIGFSFSVVTS